MRGRRRPGPASGPTRRPPGPPRLPRPLRLGPRTKPASGNGRLMRSSSRPTGSTGGLSVTSPSDGPKFLTVADVKRLHQRSIERHGGSPGILDAKLLESAVMTPQQTVFGELAHP